MTVDTIEKLTKKKLHDLVSLHSTHLSLSVLDLSTPKRTYHSKVQNSTKKKICTSLISFTFMVKTQILATQFFIPRSSDCMFITKTVKIGALSQYRS